MDNSKNLLLFQEVDGKWQPNPSLTSSSNRKVKPVIKPEMTTEEIRAFTGILPHKLPKVGDYLHYQSFLIVHESKNLWKSYLSVSNKLNP